MEHLWFNTVDFFMTRFRFPMQRLILKKGIIVHVNDWTIRSLTFLRHRTAIDIVAEKSWDWDGWDVDGWDGRERRGWLRWVNLLQICCGIQSPYNNQKSKNYYSKNIFMYDGTINIDDWQRWLLYGDWIRQYICRGFTHPSHSQPWLNASRLMLLVFFAFG